MAAASAQGAPAMWTFISQFFFLSPPDLIALHTAPRSIKSKSINVGCTRRYSKWVLVVVSTTRLVLDEGLTSSVYILLTICVRPTKCLVLLLSIV